MNYLLDRTLIVGEITEHTPQCVIDEVLKTGKSVISKPLSIDDYKKIGMYVGKNKWTISSLEKAFIHLKSFESFTIDKLDNINLDIGKQTPSNPHSLNACVLYKICKTIGITTTRNSTLEDMGNKVKAYKLFKSEKYKLVREVKQLLEERLLDKPSQLTADTIVQLGVLKNYLKSVFYDNLIPYINNHEDYNKLHDSGIIVRKVYPSLKSTKAFVPKNTYDCIAFAAINHKIDLSGCSNPFKELEYLRANPDTWIPKDNTLLKRINSSYIYIHSPYLDKVFNPSLPENLYTNSNLRSLAILEGYTLESIDSGSAYDLLQNLKTEHSFYHGKYLKLDNKHTDIYMENIDQLNDEIVSFGTPGEPMHAYTYVELLAIFSKYNRFQIPNSKEGKIFSDRNIKKLEILSAMQQYNTETDESYNVRLELSSKITSLRSYLDEVSPVILELVDKYNSTYNTEVSELLIDLLEVGMAMRGWVSPEISKLDTERIYTGKKLYPVYHSYTRDPIETTIVVTKKIVDFERKCETFGHLGELVLGLPMHIWKTDSYRVSVFSEDGYTIRDRLRIVKYEDSLSACIRLTANWFIGTVAYLTKFLEGFTLEFDIKEMSFSS